jgi:hypothetical protein
MLCKDKHGPTSNLVIAKLTRKLQNLWSVIARLNKLVQTVGSVRKVSFMQTTKLNVLCFKTIHIKSISALNIEIVAYT